MGKLQVTEMLITDIKPYENNAKKHDKEQIEFVANSLKRFGWQQPIVVDKDFVIIVGHCRYLAAKALHWDSVPVVIADNLDEDEVKAYRLADNKTNESDWLKDIMDEELASLFDKIDMTDFGFPLTIEDIDQDVEADEPIATELNEERDYVVLTFSTSEEWERAQMVLGLERVQTADANPKIRRHGIGRVIEGAPIIERLVQNEN